MTNLLHPAYALSEKAWQQQVLQLLDLTGFDLRYHTHDSRRSAAGFPDLVATREQHGFYDLLFVELKRETGQATPAQYRWLDELSLMAALINRTPGLPVRLIVDLWRPSDIGRILELLQARS